MRTDSVNKSISNLTLYKNLISGVTASSEDISHNKSGSSETTPQPEILVITTFPPRECGIATYSQDLMTSLDQKFGKSHSIRICALEEQDFQYNYPEKVKFILNTSEQSAYARLANAINADSNIKLILVQHEFGLFGGHYGEYLLRLLKLVHKPVVTTFHTILPNPDLERKEVIRKITSYSDQVIVMTNTSASILVRDYEVEKSKINVIPHGTHLISSEIESSASTDKIILSTFGLLSSGKSIETAIEALPAIVKVFPNVLYQIIGKTHPGVVKHEGERYREQLQQKVIDLNLQNNVKFINKYVTLEDLMVYLQKTTIYLFTSKDPHQAVSGTFAYAMACGCPIISTPIPHAVEMLEGAGIIYDFQDSEKLALAAIKMLSNKKMLEEMRLNALHKISSTSWQNSALSHMSVFKKIETIEETQLQYKFPEISLNHIRKLTTNAGMIQFSAIDSPDLNSGYTLDDNARALIAVTEHYELTGDPADLELIDTYLNFIIYSQQPDGRFLNYVDTEGHYYKKNSIENLEDSNGRAIWALGEFISKNNLFHSYFISRAESALQHAIAHIEKFKSPRAIAFCIKGLHHYNKYSPDAKIKSLITLMADNLVSKYYGVSDENWTWFEEYLTYANSLLPEAMLCAHLSTGVPLYREVARKTFDFLLSIIFQGNRIKVISNQGWLQKGKQANQFGEQPIDVAYTVLALSKFYEQFHDQSYLDKMEQAFSWFLGKNHLNQIIYNPVTGGCYDGLEESHVNLNQGAESTVSYLLARLTIEKYFPTMTHEQKNSQLQLYYKGVNRVA